MMGCHSEDVDATLRPGWIWVSEWSGLSSSRGCVVGMAVWEVWGLGVAAAGPRAAIEAAAPRGGAAAQQGGDVAQLRDEGHALDREHAAALQLPVLVLLPQHRPHQAHDRVVAGDDADNAGAALDRCAAMRTSRCRGWRLEGEVVPASHKDPEGWGAADKFTVVLETAAFNATELSAYCRERGLYPEQVSHWRQIAQNANAKPVRSMAEQKDLEKLHAQDQREIKALKKELQRKEKALAEAAALLVLRKKWEAFCSEDEEG